MICRSGASKRLGKNARGRWRLRSRRLRMRPRPSRRPGGPPDPIVAHAPSAVRRASAQVHERNACAGAHRLNARMERFWDSRHVDGGCPSGWHANRVTEKGFESGHPSSFCRVAGFGRVAGRGPIGQCLFKWATAHQRKTQRDSAGASTTGRTVVAGADDRRAMGSAVGVGTWLRRAQEVGGSQCRCRHVGPAENRI
jgi:hypothetical protein